MYDGNRLAEAEDEFDAVPLNEVFPAAIWEIEGAELFLAVSHKDRETPILLAIGTAFAFDRYSRMTRAVRSEPAERGAARDNASTFRDAVPLKHFSYVFPHGTVYSALVLPFG